MSGENVLNHTRQPVSGSKDNIKDFGGTANFLTTMIWNIGGVQVTGLDTLAEKLNNLDSVQEVANKSGSPMIAGALVYISGYDTTLGTPIVSLADADDATKKAALVLTEAIADNASGSAEGVATVTGLNTNSFSAVGSPVYESATAGEWTQTAPTAADDDRRQVGVIKVKSATIGEIYFYPAMGGLEHAAVYLNNLVAGTAKASGALVVDANIDIAGIRNIGCTNLDAGLSGTAGSVDIFPTTASKGKTSITSTDNAGDTTTDINVAAQAGARTLTIPDGGQATANFLLSEGAQTVAGVQTYTVPQVLDHNTGITAFATGGQGSAVALTGEYNDVTTVASAYDSVKLLTAVLGQKQTVKNSGAAILSVFPSDADSINGMAINLSVDIPVGGEITFRAISDTVWETIEAISLSAPTTQTGNLVIKASDNAANHEISITNASHGQATALTIPDGGQATANFLLSEGNQTIAGIQTYSLPNVYDVNTTITAFNGGGQGSAVALTGEYNNVTTVTAAYDSVALPTAVLGQKITVKNSGASILSVFPASSDSINALAVNLSVDIPLNGEVEFTAISDTVWETIETLYVSSPTTQTGGLAIRAAANAGNTDTTITNASQSGARTYTIPDAGGNAEFVMNQDITDYVKFLGLNDIIGGPVAGPSVGTWAMTRVAQGDYVNRKVAGDETAIIGLDVTEILRTTSSKGLKLTSIDFIWRNTVADLDAHSATLDRIEYTNSAVVSVNTIAMTGTLAVGQDNDPQISNLTIDTPLFNTTDDSKYVIEQTIDAAAASVVDWIGVVLKFTRNDK